MKPLIDQYSAYDLWANTRMVERLQREPAAVLDRHVKSSFPSLRLTVNHIRDAGCAWHGRIFGNAPAEVGNGIGSLLKCSVALHDQVLGTGEAGLLAPVEYSRASGQRYVQPRWQLLLHCFNHASYHRGQLITIMRQLDLADVPNTDLVAYQRMLPAGK
ncbi:MAG TPA: DinB family protein [Flavobacteriales bacterium]|nr:hypothetical protein [Flavobacteriales bacterium]HRN35796.1 DinB family protein [Flavobacteriales bacterium]HRO39491.1 DinB family protein [Flavobacteriales bacterium]HRP81287.1 DinB family protein [Flavobacteriales bacterium]HRQ84704.1 DinB family protein [Flavobacteriales bacterium]